MLQVPVKFGNHWTKPMIYNSIVIFTIMINYESSKAITWTSDSKPGCRGILAWSELISGVPPMITIHWSAYLLKLLRVSLNIYLIKSGFRKPEKRLGNTDLDNPCSTVEMSATNCRHFLWWELQVVSDWWEMNRRQVVSERCFSCSQDYKSYNGWK